MRESSPALMPSEWATKKSLLTEESFVALMPEGLAVRSDETGESAVATVPPRLYHAALALLNAGLPDNDPLKITRRTVDALDRMIAIFATGDHGLSREDLSHVVALSDALNTLLPPGS
jgi:hypothetical protein